jgi:hypothetical protein
MLKKKEKSSAYIQSDIERFLASGGSIERIEGMDSDSYARIREARASQRSRAKAKHQRLGLIASAHKRLGNVNG